ncbi:MAG: menaquinone reductase molybdopterin-binding-like subunit QrcB [Hyphomicrobiales bacterium]
MKIDRRSFLSFVIGGAAGTALSPLPWKLTDDLSIWSQNWPWTPVPPKGETTYVTSTCTLCPGGCGISVRRVDERVVKIEGLKGHPVNDGAVCILGAAGTQFLYGPSRVQAPMKKVDGAWQTISWDQAIGEIASSLKELRAKGQPQSVAWISDTDRGTTAELCRRFLTVYGSPNFIRTPSMQDPYEMALYLTQGNRAMAGFDLAQATFVLSFSSGLIEGWGSPPYMFQAKNRMKANGGRMSQIEARLSKTAAKADQWIPIQPGTEGALALGLIHVILKEGLYKKDFVEMQTSGVEALRKIAGDAYAPEAVSKATGLETKTVIDLAKAFAGAKKPLAICGRGAGRLPGHVQEYLAVHFLNALVGSINAPGGVVAVPEPEYINWPEPEMDAVASKGMQQPRVDGAGTKSFPMTRYLLNRLPEALAAGATSPVQVLFVSSANPAYSLVDTQSVAKAFKRIPLIVSFSSFMDETAVLADYILPNHVYLERFEDVPAARGFPKPIIGLTKPVVSPLFKTRHTGDVVMQLAKAVGGTTAGAFKWESYEACLKQTLGNQWEAIRKNGYWVDAKFAPGPFETKSKKFEFTNSDTGKLPAYTSLKAPGDGTSFPLTLVAYDSMRLTDGYIGTPPFLMKALEDTILTNNDMRVEINPATAKDLGLSDGSSAVLSTPKGNASVKVFIFEGITPGLVGMVRGLGHTAYDRFVAGKGVNTNDLMGSVEDPGSGLEAAWGIRAKLSKV